MEVGMYLNRNQVAMKLGIAPNTITTKVGRGYFPKPDKVEKGCPGGSRAYWLIETVDSYLEKNKVIKDRKDKALNDKELIIKRIKSGETRKVIAREYKISVSYIDLITKEKKKYSSTPCSWIEREFEPPKGWDIANQAFNRICS